MEFEKWLQSRLTAHGFAVGEIDGKIGQKTTDAIKAFQRDRGLEVTGTANGTTVAFLKYPSSTILPEIQAIVGDRDASPPLEALKPVQTRWPRQSEVPNFYGTPGSNLSSVEVPFDMVLAWDKSARVKRITLHEKVCESAEEALQKIAATYSAEERKTIGINIFGGSFNIRRMRGGTKLSMHSWGIAIDFDPERNQLHWGRDKARLARPDADPFWKAWESVGALSLGRKRNMDFMHLQFANL